jgi:hypothetical protein
MRANASRLQVHHAARRRRRAHLVRFDFRDPPGIVWQTMVQAAT